MWAKDLLLDALKLAVAKYQPDFVWMTLVGNDALDAMPECAKTNKTASECGEIQDQLETTLPCHSNHQIHPIHQEEQDKHNATIQR